AFADRAFAGPEMPGKGLIHHPDARSPIVVGWPQHAPLEQWRADGAEVVRRHYANVGHQHRLTRSDHVSFRDNVVLRITTGERHPRRQTDVADAGNPADAFDQPIVERLDDD